MYLQVILALVGVALGVAITNTARRAGVPSKLRSLLFGSRRKKVASVTTLVALAACSAALAAWLISSDGIGGGKIANLAAPTVTQGTPTGNGCLPGGTCDAKIVVSNPNNADLVISTVEDDGGGGGAQYNGSGCPATAVTVPLQSSLPTTITVPKNSTNLAITVPDGFKLASSAPTVCMGQTFTKGMKVTFGTS